MRQVSALALATGLAIIAGGATVYAVRASGDGCPARKSLQNPTTTFEQAPKYYVTVTFHNPNPCYGFRDEPVEITLYGPHGREAISYYAYSRIPNTDVGICCVVTLPPHGTWSIRFGDQITTQGAERIRICNIHVEALKHHGYSVWQRMPDGGAVTGHGSFPPGYDPSKIKPLPDDPTWREPCDPA